VNRCSRGHALNANVGVRYSGEGTNEKEEGGSNAHRTKHNHREIEKALGTLSGLLQPGAGSVH